MPKYTVRSRIIQGKAVEPPKETKEATEGLVIEETTYEAGSTIELDENEAYKMRHALVDAPVLPGDEPGMVKAAKKPRSESGDDLEDDENLEDALESIRNRPDNPDSGVHLHWQTQAGNAAPPVRQRDLDKQQASGTAEVGHGFERAHADRSTDLPFLGGPMFNRPDSNKTKMELEEEQKQGKGDKEQKPGNQSPTAQKPAAPGASTAPPTPKK